MKGKQQIIFLIVIINCFFLIGNGTPLLNGFKHLVSGIEGKGYHLHLVVRGEIDETSLLESSSAFLSSPSNLAQTQAGSTYHLEIEFALPKEVYIDRYELAEAHRLGLFPSFHLSDLAIDLEKPSDSPVSRPFSLKVQLPVNPASSSHFETRVPFHLRYQPPWNNTSDPSSSEEKEQKQDLSTSPSGDLFANQQQYRVTQIPHPHVHLLFEQQLKENQKQTISLISAEAKGREPILSASSFSSDLKVLTPVGLETHRMVVTLGTLLATAIGSMILIASILRQGSSSGTRPAPKKEGYRK